MGKLDALVKSVEAHTAAAEAHAKVSWSAWLKLFQDVGADMPKFLAAASLIKAVAEELGKGQMPTPQEVAQFGTDAALVVQLVDDLKAAI